MKKTIKVLCLVLSVFTVLSILFVCTSCKEKGLDIIVSDYQTGKKIVVINSIDDEEEFLALFDLLEVGEPFESSDVSSDSQYSLLFEDPKDDTYDIYLHVVTQGEQLLVKYDFEKMDEEYANTLKDMYTPENFCLSESMNVQEFMDLINNN